MRLARITRYVRCWADTSGWDAKGDEAAWFVRAVNRTICPWLPLDCPWSFLDYMKSFAPNIMLSQAQDLWTEHDIDDPIVPPEIVAAAASLMMLGDDK